MIVSSDDAVMDPFGMEHLTAWLIGSFVSMCTEVVSLSLQQVRGKPSLAVSIKVTESRTEDRNREPELN